MAEVFIAIWHWENPTSQIKLEYLKKCKVSRHSSKLHSKATPAGTGKRFVPLRVTRL